MARAEQLLNSAFNSFKVSITVYYKPVRQFNSGGSSSNFAYEGDATPNEDFTNVPRSTTMDATVFHLAQGTRYTDQELQYFVNSARFQKEKDVTRISVLIDSELEDETTEKIVINDESFFIVGGPQKRGLIQPTHKDFWLQTTN